MCAQTRPQFILQTCLPQNTSVRTPNSLCPYFQIFDQIFLCADTPPISQNEAVSKVNFSTIHLVRTVCELTFSIIPTHYTRATLFCLHQRKSFSKTAEHFLKKQRTVCAAFADADASFLERLLSGPSLFPWFRGLFLLFVGFMQPLTTNSFKPAILEDG